MQEEMSCQEIRKDDNFRTLFATIIETQSDPEKNWNVDLAYCLQQYLTKFVHSSKGTDRLNFVHAAMLIQGSACIYSKKVQFLYNLTLEFCEQLLSTSTKISEEPKVVRKKQNNDICNNVNSEELFLSLDDIPVANNINRSCSGRHVALSCLRMPVPLCLMKEDDNRKMGPILTSVKGNKIGYYNQANLNRLQLEVCGILSYFHSGNCGAVLNVLPQTKLTARDNTSPKDDHLDDNFDVQSVCCEPESPPPSYFVDTPESTEKIARLVCSRRDSSKKFVMDVLQDLPGPHDTENVIEKPVKVERIQWSPSSRLKRASLKRKLVEERKENLDEEIAIFLQDHRSLHTVCTDFSVDDIKPELNADQIAVPESHVESAVDGMPFEVLPSSVPYEEHARQQVLQSHQQNLKFHNVTEIGRLVSEWEERIKPFLDQEEARRPYNINAYGSEILNCFESNNRKQTLTFQQIVRGRPAWEVSRYFLSALMLANQENVELCANSVLDMGMSTFELTLLSRKRHHETLEEGLAAYCNRH